MKQLTLTPLIRTYRTATGGNGQLACVVLLFPMQDQFGQKIKLLPAFSRREVFRFLVTHYLGFELHRKYASLELFFLDAFQCVILLRYFHDFAFVKYSTKSLQCDTKSLAEVVSTSSEGTIRVTG